mmetsp:Transcript_107142/g.230755  ORF Transcript_107142/g.230755 Transcript_107142/m.230755 type:complete len:253 (-) Transcript_107142:1668-2426(-)
MPATSAEPVPPASRRRTRTRVRGGPTPGRRESTLMRSRASRSARTVTRRLPAGAGGPCSAEPRRCTGADGGCPARRGAGGEATFPSLSTRKSSSEMCSRVRDDVAASVDSREVHAGSPRAQPWTSAVQPMAPPGLLRMSMPGECTGDLQGCEGVAAAPRWVGAGPSTEATSSPRTSFSSCDFPDCWQPCAPTESTRALSEGRAMSASKAAHCTTTPRSLAGAPSSSASEGGQGQRRAGNAMGRGQAVSEAKA